MKKGVLVAPLHKRHKDAIRRLYPGVSETWFDMLAALVAGHNSNERRETKAGARRELEAALARFEDALEAVSELGDMADAYLSKALSMHEMHDPNMLKKELRARIRAIDLAFHILGNGKDRRPKGQPYDPILWCIAQIGLPRTEKELGPVVEYVLRHLLRPPIRVPDVRNYTRMAIDLAGGK